MKNLMKKDTMTSLEIAQVAGKRHDNVLEAIRKMEPAWEKVCKLKFKLMFTTRELPNGGSKKEPMYELTKRECLYVATKFNDEARAKLVIRWEELELSKANQANLQLHQANESAKRRFYVDNRIRQIDTSVESQMKERRALVKEQRKINADDFRQFSLFDVDYEGLPGKFPNKALC